MATILARGSKRALLHYNVSHLLPIQRVAANEALHGLVVYNNNTSALQRFGISTSASPEANEIIKEQEKGTNLENKNKEDNVDTKKEGALDSKETTTQHWSFEANMQGKLGYDPNSRSIRGRMNISMISCITRITRIFRNKAQKDEG